MYCSITFGISPGLARVPRGLALILMLGLILQRTPLGATPHPLELPPVASAPGRWHHQGRRRSGAPPRFCFSGAASLVPRGLRLLARELWLWALLHTSGAFAVTPWGQSLLLLPLALMRGGAATVAAMSPMAWLWTLLAASLLLAYVLTWYSALKVAPAGLVATLLVPAVLVTDLLNAVFVTHQASPKLLAASVLFLAGSAAVIAFRAKKETAAATA